MKAGPRFIFSVTPVCNSANSLLHNDERLEEDSPLRVSGLSSCCKSVGQNGNGGIINLLSHISVREQNALTNISPFSSKRLFRIDIAINNFLICFALNDHFFHGFIILHRHSIYPDIGCSRSFRSIHQLPLSWGNVNFSWVKQSIQCAVVPRWSLTSRSLNILSIIEQLVFRIFVMICGRTGLSAL
mmetsp:Transcript_24887/g.81929  ORF Transcript_24887/g.81929 Transcript_24887/m.81929 type:complete len:186 (-) Transcript_24887:867-1424(-)